MRSVLLRVLFTRHSLIAARRIHIGRPPFPSTINAVPLLSSQIPSRWYSASHASPADTEERVLKVLKNFDKVDISKLELTTPFTQLGLDSLDVVEVMIALEEEFHIEIPDPVADKVQNPKEIAEYIFGFMNPSRPAKHDKISEDESHH